MANQQKLEIEIDPAYSADERRAIADELIDVMVDKAKSGMGIALDEPGIASRRKKFPGYSKDYIESLDFKIAGKSKGDVNLTLSGDMLGAIELLDHKPGKLVIGFPSGTEENARAEGNILGTYGTDNPDPKKARNFLGVTRTELSSVLEQFPVEDSEDRQGTIQRIAERAAKFFGSSVTPADLVELDLENDG